MGMNFLLINSNANKNFNQAFLCQIMLLNLCLYYMKETVTAVAHRAPHRAKLFHRFRTHPIDIYEHIDSRS